MVSETWFAEIESTIFTYLQHMLSEVEDAPYPDINWTTSNQNISDIDVFPAVYVHLLPPLEIGNDLYNADIPALNTTFEIQVFSDKSETHCRKIMTSCVLEMKKLRFNIQMLPDPQVQNKKYFAIARFNRIIASGDADIVPRK